MHVSLRHLTDLHLCDECKMSAAPKRRSSIDVSDPAAHATVDQRRRAIATIRPTSGAATRKGRLGHA